MGAAVPPLAVGAVVLLGTALALYNLRHELGVNMAERASLSTAQRQMEVQLRGLSRKAHSIDGDGSGSRKDVGSGRTEVAAAAHLRYASAGHDDQAHRCATGEDTMACCCPTSLTSLMKPETHQAPPQEASVDRYGDQYLALCLMIKNQQEDIREWVAHHHAVGVGKFYLYDTGSEPPLNETLEDHLADGLVEHIWWGPPNYASAAGTPAKAGLQHWAYRDCLKHYRERHQFIGFVDADEFIILKNRTASLPGLLRHMQAFEDIGGFVMLWLSQKVMFDTSGHVQRPEGGVLQAYTKCTPGNTTHAGHIKSIVNTDYVIDLQSSHHFRYKNGKYAVNEHFQRVDGPTCFGHPHLLTHDKVALHHYVLKSEEEYKSKMQRGAGNGSHKDMAFFHEIEDAAVLNCTDGVHWGPYE